MAQLLLHSGPLRGRGFQLNVGETCVVGRGKTDVDIHIPDRNMSRRHCRIESGVAGFSVTDENSTNGTFLNGSKIRTAVLKNGDRIKVGDTEIEFRQVEQFEEVATKPETAARKPKPAAGRRRPTTKAKPETAFVGGTLSDLDGVYRAARPAGTARGQVIKAEHMAQRTPAGQKRPAPATVQVAPKPSAPPAPSPPKPAPAQALAAKPGPAPEAPAEPAVVVRRARMQFCDGCGCSIPLKDLESGAAATVGGKLLCSRCKAVQGGGK